MLWRCLGAGLLMPLIAFATQTALWDIVAPFAWLLFYPVIFFAPRVGGLGGGVIATLFSATLVVLRFLPTTHTGSPIQARSLWSVAIFVTMGVVFSMFQARLRTAEHAAEKALRQLRQSERRKDEYLATVADAVLIVDASGSIVYANARAEQLFGYGADELIGRSHDVLLPARFVETHSVLVRGFFEAPSSRPLHDRARELVAVHKDGRELDVEISLNPLHTSEGWMVSTVVRDISERLRLERTAREHAARLRAAIETIPDPFWLQDPAGRLTHFNAAFSHELQNAGVDATVGMKVSEILARTKKLLAPMREEDRALFVKRRLEGRITGSDTYEVRTARGRIYQITSSRTPDGGIVTVAFDRTREVEHTHALERARLAAEAANEAKSEFLSSMSHELRTPLNAVLGFAQLLRRARGEQLSSRQLGMVNQIARAGEQFLSLIDEVLDLAHVERGQVALTNERVQVGPLLEEAITSVRPAARAAGVELRVDGSSPLFLYADRGRFRQIVLNFCSNAIKYNRRGGNVVLTATAEGPRVRVAVADNGPGIAEDKRGALFEQFYRAGQESGPIAGTGIGLALSKRLAELMQGSVGYQPLAAGSVFWVELPSAASEASDGHGYTAPESTT